MKVLKSSSSNPSRAKLGLYRGLWASLGLALALPACGGGEKKPDLAEALATDSREKFLKEQYKPSEKLKEAPPEDILPPPTDAELKAWDRKDPAGEKHLYKWDKRNSDRMIEYWKQLRCYREKVSEEGRKAFGAEPQSPEDEKWYQFKRVFIPFVNRWQQRLFANEPRILEKSKYISNILEAHELVMNGYPSAFNDGDELALKKVDAHWIVVEDKVKRYTEQIGAKWSMPDPEKPKELKKWNEFCEKAMVEPKKGPKKVKKKTSI